VATAAPVRMALVGAGRWGKNHLHTLLASEEVELVAVCESDELALAAAAHLAPEAIHARSLGELDLRQLDALVVATPTRTHAAVATAALERGLHVLLEKPVCSRPNEVSAVLEAARRSDRTLMLGCQMLHHPAHRALVALAPALEPHTVTTVRSSRPRAGGDVLLEALAPHDLATAVSLLEAVRPGARLRCTEAVVERDGTLVAHLLSDSPNWLSVELRWARTSGPLLRTTTLVGHRGALTLDEASGRLSEGKHDELGPHETPLSLQLSAFVRRIRGLPSPGLSFDQIAAVASLSDAIERTLARSRESTGPVNRVSRWRNEESRH
jgi:predicted dehydrogenase